MKRTDIRLYLFLESEAAAVDRMATAWAARFGQRLKHVPSKIVKTAAGDPRSGLHFLGRQQEPPALAAAMVGGFVGLVVMFPCKTFGPFNEAFAIRGTPLYGVARIRLTEENEIPKHPPDRPHAQFPWGLFAKDDGDEWSIVAAENSEAMIDFLFAHMHPFGLAAAFLTVSHLVREIEIAANAARAGSTDEEATRGFVIKKLTSLGVHSKELTSLLTTILPAEPCSLRVELERVNSEKQAFALRLAASLGIKKAAGLGLSLHGGSRSGSRPIAKRPPAAASRPLRVLHISDLHERAAFPAMPSERNALLAWDAEERGLILGPRFSESLGDLARYEIDLVCFTGDLADWGRPEEYDAVASRLEQILQTVKVPKERFFAVPGNHDVQRGIQKPAWRKLRKWHAGAQRHAELGRWLRGIGESPVGKSVTLDKLLARTAAFWNWLSTFGRPDLHPTDGKFLGYRHTLPVGTLPHVDMPVHVVGLDSSWFCGDDADQGRIVLTEEQVQAHVRDGEQPLDGFRIGLVHHPLDHLADHHDVRRLLADDGVDLLLHGHQHAPIATVVDEPGARLRIIAAGCLVEGERGKGWPNGFQLIEIHPRRRKLSVHFRKWSREGRFWAKGSDLYRDAPDGVLTLHDGKRNKSRYSRNRRLRAGPQAT